MEWYFYLIISISVLILILFLLCLYIYFQIFYNDRKLKPDCLEPLKGRLYKPLEEKSRELIKKALEIPFEQVYLKVNKHKVLAARYYFSSDSAPTAILVHGYKGNGIRDFSGGVQEVIKRGNNVLVIDHYGHNLSSGRTITFGVKEKYDVLKWIDYINKRNNNPDIYLYGISMGAATVLMCSGLSLPNNVKAILADSPYASIKEEIKFVMEKRKLNFTLLYPFVFLSALLFARFNIKKGEVSNYLKNNKLPILIMHGNTDDLVPVSNSRKLKEQFPYINYVEIDNAPHGMGYVVDYDKYVSELDKFLLQFTQ
ncbi:MAG: alpha/beta hydrolase [Bacilli bacterium]|nr:alpha/beta hydrolase [Bacilli bacterium]